MMSCLKEIRKSKSISGYEMAELLKLKSPSTYYKKEKGIIPLTLDEAQRIAEYFNMSINEIFFIKKVSL